MPKKKLADFNVEHWQILDENGTLDETMFPKEITETIAKEMFYWMVQARSHDEKMLKLQRTGRMGTFGRVLGQEAQVGVGFAMGKEDWLVPSFRETVVQLKRGITMESIMTFYGGSEEGHRIPKGVNVLPISIPVGTQPLHAVGMAWGFQLRGEKKAVVTFMGDGGTSEGDFHEAMNFAGVFQVPCVFVNQNNQWAISVPRSRQSHSQTLAQKAIAYGMEGIQVDGNDVFAVYAATKYAIEKAKSGKGPTLIEMVTYRMGDHTTADDSTKYRNASEVEEWRKKDPIDRLKKFLQSKGWWSQPWEDQTTTKANDLVEKAVAAYEARAKPNPLDMFDYMYEKVPKDLQFQRDYLEQNLKEQQGKGGE